MSSQDLDSNAKQGFPSLCSNGCRFVGASGEQETLCSVCSTNKEDTKDDKALQSNKESCDIATLINPHQTAQIALDKRKHLETEDLIDSTIAGDNADEDRHKPVHKKLKKSRCPICQKKLGLTSFSCRCGGVYCSTHRYSDKHQCDFDYKAFGKKEISENNSVVVGQKVMKI